MRQGLRGAWVRSATAVAMVAFASLAPCLAGPPIPVPGGGLLAVEAVGLDGKTPTAAGRELAWIYSDAYGVRAGLVPTTTGPEPDATPVLATDPRTGTPVLIWSRWDGQAMKLAWSRFDSGSWSDPRDVTYGPGNDLAPAIGISSAGAYLFFRRDNAKVLYAPIDLGTGRLFAAPTRLLNPAILKGRDWKPDGGTDVPILIGVCSPTYNGPCVSPGGPPVIPGKAPRAPGIEGGTDVPIVITSPVEAPEMSISVASRSDCQTMLVGIGRGGHAAQRIVAFDGAGRVRPIGRVVADGVTQAEALAAATSHFLGAACR